MHLTNGEINSFCKFILIIQFKPIFDKPSRDFLYVVGYLKGSELLSFENNIILCSLWWFAKLCSIRRLIGNFPKNFLCLCWRKIGSTEHGVRLHNLSLCCRLVRLSLKSLGPSDVNDCFENSQAL